MKKMLREFIIFFGLMQLPVYGVYFWIFLEYLSLSFLIAWFLTNCIYAGTMFPFFKWGIFGGLIKRER